MAAIKNEIGYSSLTDRVYLGKKNPKKRMWVGEKRDVTSEFIAVSLEYFEEGTIRSVGCDGINENLIVNIKNNKKSITALIKKLKNILSKTPQNDL